MLLAAGLLGPTKVAAAPALSTVHAVQVTTASPSARGSPHLAPRLGLKTPLGQQDKSKCDKGRDLIPPRASETTGKAWAGLSTLGL